MLYILTVVMVAQVYKFGRPYPTIWKMGTFYCKKIDSTSIKLIFKKIISYHILKTWLQYNLAEQSFIINIHTMQKMG